MNWITIFAPSESDTYGHWRTENNHYSIQCFVFKNIEGNRRKVKPYYTVFNIWKGSKKIGEFTTLTKAQKSVDL